MEEPTMADTGIGRILTTKVISPTLSVGQGVREKGGGEQESAQPKVIVVIEQWICLVLGLVCMALGMWGICMKWRESHQHNFDPDIRAIWEPVFRFLEAVNELLQQRSGRAKDFNACERHKTTKATHARGEQSTDSCHVDRRGGKHLLRYGLAAIPKLAALLDC